MCLLTCTAPYQFFMVSASNCAELLEAVSRQYKTICLPTLFTEEQGQDVARDLWKLLYTLQLLPAEPFHKKREAENGKFGLKRHLLPFLMSISGEAKEGNAQSNQKFPESKNCNFLKARIAIGHCDSWAGVMLFVYLSYLCAHECEGECRAAFLGWL